MAGGPKLFDAHCHLDFSRFDGIRNRELAKARDLGVAGVVIPGVRRPDWERLQTLADPRHGIWYCLGIHPWYIQEHSEADLEALDDFLGAPPAGCLAVGECGLDKLRGSLAEQEPWFLAQVGIAQKYSKPLVIHSVRAHDRVCRVLRLSGWSGRALLHGFSGSYQQACELIELGCYIGVGGVITRPGAHKTREAIARLPRGTLVLETDAPDMAPVGVERGRNSPAELPRIFTELASLCKAPKEVLADQLLANVSHLYGLTPERLAPF